MATRASGRRDRRADALVIAVVARKGGAGKSTVTVNLGGALAEDGRRVLLVDADDQGAVGAMLGCDELPPTLYELLQGTVEPREAVRSAGSDRLEVITATDSLAGAAVELPCVEGWHYVMHDALQPLTADYDVVLIDSAPGLGVLPILSMVAAQAVLIACPPAFLSVRTLRGLRDTVDKARSAQRARRLSPEVRSIGIVPTLTEARSGHQADFFNVLRQDYGHALLPAVPKRVVLQHAAAAGMPVVQYAPHSDSAEVFRALAKEVLTRARQT